MYKSWQRLIYETNPLNNSASFKLQAFLIVINEELRGHPHDLLLGPADLNSHTFVQELDHELILCESLAKDFERLPCFKDLLLDPFHVYYKWRIVTVEFRKSNKRKKYLGELSANQKQNSQNT